MSSLRARRLAAAVAKLILPDHASTTWCRHKASAWCQPRSWGLFIACVHFSTKRRNAIRVP